MPCCIGTILFGLPQDQLQQPGMLLSQTPPWESFSTRLTVKYVIYLSISHNQLDLADKCSSTKVCVLLRLKEMGQRLGV